MQESKTIIDYIVVYEKIISDELCNEILGEYSNDAEWIPTAIGSNNEINKTIRSAETIGISYQNVIEKNLILRKALDKKIFDCVTVLINRYDNKFCVGIQEDSGYELLRYKEKQFYAEHVDFFKQKPRSVSCSIALNDNYEGGEFAFFNRKLKYKMSKGSAILFPSNFMYPHEIMPVVSGVRYSLITWFV